MAITSAEEQRAVGEINREGRSATVTYLVISDSNTDGPQIVINHFRDTPTLPFINDLYQFQSESNSFMLCKSIRPRQHQEQPKHWTVDVMYGPRDEQDIQQQDVDGNYTEDPTEWRPELRISTYFEEVVADGAKYLSGYNETAEGGTGSGSLLLVKGPTTPCDSAMNPFNPPAVKRLPIDVWTVSKRHSYALNQEDVETEIVFKVGMRIALAKFVQNQTLIGTALGADSYEIKIIRNDVSLEYENGVEHWLQTVDYAVDRHRTWRPEFLDVGMDARGRPGDPDGRGGFLPSTTTVGVPEKRPLKDNTGHRLSDPVPLNGNGQPNAADADNVYSRWSLDPTREKTLILPFAFVADGIIETFAAP